MYFGKLVFAQLVDHLPLHTFRRCVARYRGHRKVKSFSCFDQFVLPDASLNPARPARSIACCTNPEALASSINSLM